MIKMLISFCIGAGAMYLYIHPGNVDDMQQNFIDATNQGEKVLVVITSD